jgi:hypothetical protein
VTLIEGCYRLTVNTKLTVTEEPEDVEFNRRMDRFQRNGEWLTEHGAPLFERFPGQYVAVSEGDVFVSDNAWAARQLAREKHPDDEPFVQYIRGTATSASMRVDGRWHRFKDGTLRPVIDAAVQTPEGTWQLVMFLLDAGADRTVVDASFLPLLSPLALPTAQTPELGGVGGKVGCVFIQTRLAFARDDGQRVTVQGPFGVFTDPATSEVPILGRDVTNNFDVIYSYPKRQVTLLAPPHDYQIQLRS